VTDPGTLIIAFAIAFAVTFVATPVVIRIARRLSFYDVPAGYKQHAAPTPYLGGVAVISGLAAGTLAVSAGTGEIRAALGIAAVLLVVGTLDDRLGLGIGVRIAAQVAAGFGLYQAGISWPMLDAGAANLLLTIVFVVGTINAYNLMDNLDGATGTVALVSAGALGIYAAVDGDALLAPLALALAGACASFLPYNLARPSARIFLGDGGSMPIGFLIAAVILAAPGATHLGWGLVPVAVVMVGLPAFDTTLVIVSRLKQGDLIMSGGRDHLTHRLLEHMDSPRRVARALAIGQAEASALAILCLELSPAGAAVVSILALLAGAALVALVVSRQGKPAPERTESVPELPRHARAVREKSPA
jgi:UDP-GlcNAc:undecaprenyl-phosphate/decaprenyl-phosphate GlcNAc-1-phosphate transferase